MARARREINIFNLSFLDVLSCGLGAVVVLFIIGFLDAKDVQSRQEDLKKVQDAVEDMRRGHAEKLKVTRALKDLIDELELKKTADAQRIDGLRRQLDRLQTINFVGIHTRRKNLLVVMDLSGSMYDADPHYATPKDKLVTLARALVQALPGQEFRFNVMGFWSREPELAFPLFEQDGRFVPADAAARERAETWIQTTVDAYEKNRGGTPTWAAIQKAASLPGVEAVILITDGAPSECLLKDEATGAFLPQVPLLDAFRARVRAFNRGRFEIHCIGVGKELYEPGRGPAFRRFLKVLAEENGGGFASF